MSNTTLHGWTVPDAGDTDWAVTMDGFFSAIDEDVLIRDADSNKSNYSPINNAVFLATDTGKIYTGDGNNWNELTDGVGQEWETKTKSGNYTLNNYETVLADASGSAITQTLPAPSSDLRVSIHKTDSNNDVTIATPNNESINGDSNKKLTNQHEAMTITSDGSNYFIV